MKYLEPGPFTSRANSNSYRDNYDRVFSNKREEARPEENKHKLIAVDVTERYVRRYYVTYTGNVEDAKRVVEEFREQVEAGGVASEEIWSMVGDTGSEFYIDSNPKESWEAKTLVEGSEDYETATYLLAKQAKYGGHKRKK